METDPKADSGWRRADVAYQYYASYLQTKADRCSLELADLLYVKNFKGGNSIISEPPEKLVQKLAQYEEALREANASEEFQSSLRDLGRDEFERAKTRMQKFVELPLDPEFAITGLGVSLASALLHFQFPTVVPVLDRRALNGAGIQGLKVDKQGQVTNLVDLYSALIDYSRERLLKDSRLTLRELDRELFTRRLGASFRSAKTEAR